MNDPQQAPLDHPQTSPPSVDLHIEELVLHGFTQDVHAAYRAQIGVAVEQELTRLLAEQGVPTGFYQDGAAARLDGGTFEIRPDARAEAIGAQVAQAVYRGFGR